MKNHLKLLMSGVAVSAMLAPLPAFAQTVTTEDTVTEIDEITVTARKREETLTEVPVSISVLTDQLVEDAGILTQQDLFDLVPGIQYDEQIDRNSASPSIRGVSTDEIATNRTKVTQFIDGMPVLGSQGNIQFGTIQQVEVFRGPQSAAFGRSTFGGAINYVTKDPGDEFEAAATLDVNDYGGRRASVSVGGPITDTLGFLAGYQWEDSDSPYETTEDFNWGERSSNAYSGKLVWEPTDNFTAEIAASHVESDDTQSAAYFIGIDALEACWDGTLAGGMGGGVYADGTPNCDWSQGATIVSQSDYVPAVAAAIDAGQVAGVASGTQAAEDLLFIADAQSAKVINGARDERDRVQLQLDYSFDSGAIAQFSAFVGTEEYIRLTDGQQDARAFDVAFDAGTGFFTPNAMGTVGTLMADPSEIEEKYAEVRYVSPGEDRLRYVVGASIYDYEFLTTLYFGGYKSILDGTTGRYDALVGNYYTSTDLGPDGMTGGPFSADDVVVLADANGDPLAGNIAYNYANGLTSGIIDPTLSVSNPGQLFQETATNVGLYGNVSYDFTDRLTATFEGRYQIDEVGGTNPVTGQGGELTTEAFLPRISANYNLDSGTSFYAQYARGNNPAGVNVGFFDPILAGTLDCTDPVGTLFPGSDTDCGQNFVDYTSEQMAFFEEETIDNYEIGAKGQLLDGDLTFATAVFFMDWQNQGRTVNLDWTDPDQNLMGLNYGGNRTLVNEGEIEMKGIEFEGTFNLTDDLSFRGQFSYLDAKYADYCDLNLIGGGYVEEAALTLGVDDANNTTGYTCVDVSGKQVVQQAPWTGSISPSYRTELSNGLRLSARADVRYEGSQFLDTINQFETDPVITTNVSTGLTGDKWGLTLYVNNLFDENQPLRYGSGDDYSRADPLTGEDFTQNFYITPRTPRTIGLRANINY